MEYNIGDIVKTKKTHPCGNNQWEITRIGVDFKLKCQGCRPYCHNGKTKSIKSNNKNNKEKRRGKLICFFFYVRFNNFPYSITIYFPFGRERESCNISYRIKLFLDGF